MDVGELGEFALIERLRHALPAQAPAELIIGIGDDAAVWRLGDRYTVATTDTMVDGVHFVSALTPPQDVGWKALAANISDIAAMGGTPTFALITPLSSESTDSVRPAVCFRHEWQNGVDIDSYFVPELVRAAGKGLLLGSQTLPRTPPPPQ